MNFDYQPGRAHLSQRGEMARTLSSERRWQPAPLIEELKPKARAARLWNLWQPKNHGGALSNLDLDSPRLLLASESSRYMTGTVIPVDGGHLCSAL
jgi:NAD(P)-dependent dehydrogenase (short-subunit alcohol dehydrogenase family)